MIYLCFLLQDNLDLSPVILHGDSHFKARFGTSIASAKDLNNDGYEGIPPHIHTASFNYWHKVLSLGPRI